MREKEPSNNSQPIESTPIPEGEYEKVVEEKMCVLRSLASVGEAFTETDVELDRSQVEQRLAQTNEVTARATQQIEQAMREQKQRGEMPVYTLLKQLDEVIGKGRSEDKLNIKAIVNSLTIGEGESNALKESMSGLTARYEAIHGYRNLEKLLKNPYKQTCVILPGHMMHVALNEEGRLVSLSDKDNKGYSQEFTEVVTAINLSYAPDDYNAIVFTKEERLAPDVLDRLNDNFLDTTASDPDVAHAVEKVEGFGDRPLYPPDVYLAEEGRYPEVTDYKEPDKETGNLQKPEAIALGSLARKVAVLEKAFGKSDETTRQLKRLYEHKASEVGMDQVSENIWPTDVTEGIKKFVDYMNTVSQVREKLQTPKVPEKKSRLSLFTKEKKVTKLPYEIEQEQQQQLFAEPLRQDNNEIGQHTVDALVEYIASHNEISEQNPGGARNATEVEGRVLSRKLGLKIAADYYLKALQLES